MEGLRGGGESRKPYLQTDPKQKLRFGRRTLFLSPKTTLIAVISLWNHKCGLHPFSSCPLFSPHPLQSPSLSSFHSILPPSCCNLPSLLFWILPKLPNWPLSLRIIFSPTSALTASRRNVLNFISDAGCPWLTPSSGSLLPAWESPNPTSYLVSKKLWKSLCEARVSSLPTSLCLSPLSTPTSSHCWIIFTCWNPSHGTLLPLPPPPQPWRCFSLDLPQFLLPLPWQPSTLLLHSERSRWVEIYHR